MKHCRLIVFVVGCVACNAGGSESVSTGDAADSARAFGPESGVVVDSSSLISDSVRLVPRTAMSSDVEVLSGQPDSSGKPFVIRIRELPGTIVPPHTHPVDEHITIVQGTWFFGTGKRFDSTALRKLPAGSYAFAPAGTAMFAYAPELTIVQVHGIGPFRIHWLDGSQVLDEPGGAAAFRFRRGEDVTTPHGQATIQQGYRSGSIIQYEVVTRAGGRYMVSEHAIRRLTGT
jgi:quercetin dioxygenase-like cupin family protein